MPKNVRKNAPRNRKPESFEVLEETLEALTSKMREAEAEETDNKVKSEILWPIFQIHHQRSRYIYDMFYKKKQITRECYEYCLQKKIADAKLIAKWKKQGYERLCCLMCIQSKDSAHGGTCICRVPNKSLEEDRVIECRQCGCRGCASGG